MTKWLLVIVVMVLGKQPLSTHQYATKFERIEKQVCSLVVKYNQNPDPAILKKIDQLLNKLTHNISEVASDNLTRRVLLGPHACKVVAFLDSARSTDKRHIEAYIADWIWLLYEGRDRVRTLDSLVRFECQTYSPSSLSGVKAYLKKWNLPSN